MRKRKAGCSLEEYLKRVGATVRAERNRQKLSLRTVADRCRASHSSVISHYSVHLLEKGKSVQLGTVFQVADVLGIPPGVLLNPYQSEQAQAEHPTT